MFKYDIRFIWPGFDEFDGFSDGKRQIIASFMDGKQGMEPG